jgi:class 3 adenylate cyclase
MGLNSGEVVVGKIGDDLRMDYTALGHTANLAAWMKQIAEAGKALLTEYTAKLVSGQTGEECSGADDDLLDDRPAGAGQVHEVRVVRARQPSSLGLPGGIHGSAIVEPELDHRIPGGSLRSSGATKFWT